MKKVLNDTSDTPPPPLAAPLPRLLTHINAQPVQWLWHHRIPLGCLTVLEGAAGIGTSLFASTIAAAVSVGLPLPEQNTTSKSTVILVTPHLSDASTIRPRLEAAGGDPANVIFLRTRPNLHEAMSAANERTLIFPDDINILQDTIIACHSTLAIIDPLHFFLHRSRGHNTQDILLRLSEVAETTRSAILLVRHLKPQENAPRINSDAGFPGLIASAACVLRLIHCNPGLLHLKCTKHNHSQKPETLKFQMSVSSAGIPLCLSQEEKPYPPPQITTCEHAILRVLQNSSDPLNALQITRLTRYSYDTIRHYLTSMTNSGQITRLARGLYTVHPQPSTSEASPNSEQPPDSDQFAKNADTTTTNNTNSPEVT